MEALAQFIAGSPKRPMEAWAKEFGISRSYLTEILSRTKQPGRATIEKISAATSGAVPPESWFRTHSTKTGDAA
jgi:transcriptional regulator with XRE-family HTH domain